ARVREVRVADVGRVEAARGVDLRPVVTAVRRLVEAVVRSTVPEADRGEDVARVLRVDDEVVDDVHVGRVLDTGVRPAWEVARVRLESRRPRGGVFAERRREDAAAR